MLWTPPGPCFQAHVSNLTGRPASTSGTSHTCGANNTKAASFTELIGGGSVTFDVYEVVIDFRDGAVGGGDNFEMFVDLGYDPTNSGSYTVKVANLQAGHAANFDSGTAGGAVGGISYRLPLFFKAGTQFGIRGQTNDNTTKTIRAALHLYGKPKYPCRAGAYCDTFGADTATTLGVTVTPGTTNEGAWADIKGSDTTKSYWFWEMGMSTADTTMTNNLIYFQDLGVGDGSNKYIVQEDQDWVSNGGECLSKNNGRAAYGYYDVGPGVRPYVRSQCSGTPDSNMNCVVYAVGG